MDWSPPASSLHRISQAKILEWVTISSSRDLCDLEINSHRPHLLHWQADSLPLSHLGSPSLRAGKPKILDIVLIPGECPTLAVLTSSQQILKNSLCMLLLQLRPHPHDSNSASQMFLHKAPFRSSHRRKSTVPNPFPRKRWWWWWVSSTHGQQWCELCCGV